MIEKVRFTLWDIFSFFLTGFLIACIYSLAFVVFGDYELNHIVTFLKELPSSVLLVVAPLLFTLIGMLIEPLANYFDKYITKYLLWWVQSQKDVTEGEENILKDEIKISYLGSLNGKIDNPYHFCKEYVETKQLSTTFMVFLSRHGFYRNCSFISFVTGTLLAVYFWDFLQSTIAIILAYFFAAVFKKRSDDFFSYMAPAIYRAFLIDKLDYVKKNNV